MIKIPPIDLKRQYQQIKEETAAKVLEILNSGRYIGGEIVANFEQQFAEYIGVSQCVSCNSGTDALYLAMRALNIGEGDEVITTPFTFIATTEVIVRVGAKPVFVDIQSETFNLNVDAIESAITNKTKAIIPVHLFGQPVNMTQLMAIASKHNLFVIEDCAQATGAQWNHQRLGSIGDVGCFSFFPTKNLGAFGDGGALTTNNTSIAQSARMLKEHGSSVRYQHDRTGINSRLDTIQAGILQIKLPLLDDWNQQRREIAANYQELLAPIKQIETPLFSPENNSVWNQYTIKIRYKGKYLEESLSSYRDRIRQKLQENGISTMVYYPLPLHLQPVYQKFGYKKGKFPISERISSQVLSLPMFISLSLEEQQQIVYGLKDSLDSI